MSGKRKKTLISEPVEPKHDTVNVTIAVDMPQFLVMANDAIKTGQTEQAKNLLNPEAIKQVHQMHAKDPSRTDVMFMLAVMLHKTGQLDKAEQWFKKILEVEPNALAYNGLAEICISRGALLEPIKYLRKAMELAPDIPAICYNLAEKLIGLGEMEEVVGLLRRMLTAEPDSIIHRTNFLFNLHFLPNIDHQMLFAEHKRWGRIEVPPGKFKTSHDNIPDSDRRLRIGYISPDFREHPVAYFFESLLDGHNRRNVEVYGYGNVAVSDEVTERFKLKFDRYRNVLGIDDETVAGMIEADKIDILVDLAGHTAGNRLGVLAYKPAPIQAGYLGYPDTTGMWQIDYRLTDKWTDSAESEKFHSEQLVYLPDGFSCYSPPSSAPDISPLPAKQNGYITFGSFNNSLKINPFIMELWAQILRAVSGSCLLLKFKKGAHQEVRNHYFHKFERLGIPPERVEIHGWQELTESMGFYRNMDIALDTYPYNGTTTTCEALWMGVPTISLIGKPHISRVGLSILNQVGLEFFATSTPEEYVAKATALAAKPESLAKIRASMRQRMINSPLCNAKTFAVGVEEAYRKMWHKWCADKNVDICAAKTAVL